MGGGPPWCFYEFFAGGGLARLGLGRRWRCVLANDHCPRKAAAYRDNFGPSAELIVADVAQLKAADAPGRAMLAWASFPCQDLSLAGGGRGLSGARSGAFWPFWRLMEGLIAESRPPRVIVLENVVGAITSRSGADFRAILEAMVGAGCRFGPLVIDAAHFTPQSRRRLFVVAVHHSVRIPAGLVGAEPVAPWQPPALAETFAALPVRLQEAWVWWALPPPPPRRSTLADILQDPPEGVSWHSRDQTLRLIELMAPRHRRKLEEARQAGGRVVGAIYRRTRPAGADGRRQRAEVRFDGLGGCLRTPAGGSSRQVLVVVEDGRVRTRLLGPREAARLMGAPESYRLPASYNAAYHLLGDGVVAPAVGWLEEQLLAPLARAAGSAAPRARASERRPR